MSKQTKDLIRDLQGTDGESIVHLDFPAENMHWPAGRVYPAVSGAATVIEAGMSLWEAGSLLAALQEQDADSEVLLLGAVCYDVRAVWTEVISPDPDDLDDGVDPEPYEIIHIVAGEAR